MENKNLINIGRIIGTHGYKGTVKILPLTDFPQRFKKLKRVKVNKAKEIIEFDIESISLYKNLVLIKFTGIDSKEEAQKYKDALLKIEEDQVYQLPEGYYYYYQLQGLEVYDLEKGYLGVLVDILETGANDVYVINSEANEEILIPAIKEVILNIDLHKKQIKVKLLPGLLDI